MTGIVEEFLILCDFIQSALGTYKKGTIINPFYKRFFPGLLLSITPIISFGFGNGAWDCQQRSDGKTWSCSAAPVKQTGTPNDLNNTLNTNEVPKSAVVLTPEIEAPTSVPAVAEPTVEVTQPTETASTTEHTDSDLTADDLMFQQMISKLDTNPWGTCEITPKESQVSQQQVKQNRLNATVDIQSDYAELLDRDTALFTGNVVVNRADQTLTADTVNYQNKSGVLDAQGDTFYQSQGFALHSNKAHLQLNDDTGDFENIHFILEGNHARGTSRSTELISKDISKSTDVSYSTCAPGATHWELQAETLELDKGTGRGVGRNVWVEVFDMPIFYTPYIDFPIDDRRKTGFLVPSFGVTDNTGVDIAAPYYWNIAPNYDATITPRIMSDRGFMLGGEFRYLTNNSEGQVSGEIIDDSDTDDMRGAFSLQNRTQFTSRLISDIDLNYQSDDEYQEDFGNNLLSASGRYLKSDASLNYYADNWDLLTKIDNYESIDNENTSTSDPYRRLPQVKFKLHETDALAFAKLNMDNEFVYFDHSDNTTAQRLDLQPSISAPFRTPASFIIPKIGVRHTSYLLDNQPAGNNDDTESRTLPVLSIDSGLFFERDLDIGSGMLQTLEPRAFYLYVPHKDQDDIPLFDTAENNFSFNQLFRENRFSGADRMGDANQLTLAVTSRFIESATGSERARASLGTIVYFEDLDVGLNSTSAPISKGTSDIISELSGQLSENWSVRTTQQFDPHAEKMQRSTAGIHYRDENERIFNATYRSRYDATDTDIEQTDVSFKWPINNSWSTVGRWNYSQEENLSLETFLGFEKDTCCWRLRVIARRYVNNDIDEEPTEGLFFQFELKGLTSLGGKIDTFLEQGIQGYQKPED